MSPFGLEILGRLTSYLLLELNQRRFYGAEEISMWGISGSSDTTMVSGYFRSIMMMRISRCSSRDELNMNKGEVSEEGRTISKPIRSHSQPILNSISCSFIIRHSPCFSVGSSQDGWWLVREGLAGVIKVCEAKPAVIRTVFTVIAGPLAPKPKKLLCV